MMGKGIEDQGEMQPSFDEPSTIFGDRRTSDTSDSEFGSGQDMSDSRALTFYPAF